MEDLVSWEFESSPVIGGSVHLGVAEHERNHVEPIMINNYEA